MRAQSEKLNLSCSYSESTPKDLSILLALIGSQTRVKACFFSTMLPLLPLCLSSMSISGWSLHNPHIICHRKSSNIMSNNHPIPALISLPRIRTLVASLFVMLGSGTNYVSKDFFDHFITQMWILLGVFRWGSALAAFVEGEYDKKNNILTLFLCVAYSPQLGTRLKISHTQLNMVALAGNGAEFRAFQQPTWRFF